jgi:hypothetical protein
MVRFDVAYYDEAEQKLFKTANLSDRFDKIVASGIDIDEFELQSVGLFNEQFDIDGWRTRADLRERAKGRHQVFNDYFAIENERLVARRPPLNMAPGTTEWMGVAASLSTMDAAFGVHAADWTKLDIGDEKDMDFQVASTGEHFVVVESKGSVVRSVNLKEGLSDHKRSIKEKKDVQRPKPPGRHSRRDDRCHSTGPIAAGTRLVGGPTGTAD